MDDMAVLKNIVRVGWISSVNAIDRTARVTFQDKGDAFVSGPLKVIKNQPFIPRTTEETSLVIDNTSQEHAHELITSPYLPKVGDFVLCIYLPQGDGFVIGGI